jgi:hypothetical protein
MHPPSFSPRVRVLVCTHCAAPIQSALGGGVAACSGCGAQHHVAPRDDRPLAPSDYVDEARRMAHLRAQDGRPRELPAALKPLAPTGQLEEWKVNEAHQVWHATLREVRSSGGADASERLTLLTLLLWNHLAGRPEYLLQSRALAETALDAVTLPRHRQLLRGLLSRAAARDGDLPGAEEWLRPCDPRSPDLECDTAYRFSRAFIDTAYGRFQEVLSVLGGGPDDVPIQDACDAGCAVLRANAWERLGQLQPAVAILDAAMRAGGRAVRDAISATVAASPQLALCPTSLPLATRSQVAHASQAASGMAGGGVAGILAATGTGLLVTGAGTVVLCAFLGFMTGDLLMCALIGVLCLVTLVPVALGLRRWGKSFGAEASRAARLQVHGTAAHARILRATPTGTQVNQSPQMALDLLVHVDGRSPYQATARTFVSFASLGMLVPGTMVAVRVDPSDPTSVALEAA